MSGLLPLSHTLVPTLVGVDGFYKLSTDEEDEWHQLLYPLRRLDDYDECAIEIYDSNKRRLGFIHWNNWNEGEERVSDYSTYFDENWGEFGATATSDFKSIGHLCQAWHMKWKLL
jgi:hypothetical protein